jgi:hypothetical protein
VYQMIYPTNMDNINFKYVYSELQKK